MYKRLEQFRTDFVQTGIISEIAYLWLCNNGFFTAPASVKHHGNYAGGLYDHSVCVMDELEGLTGQLGLEWERPESPRIVGMFHDLCKIDSYVPNTDTSVVEAFKYADPILCGHGEKSVMFLSQLMTLTMEEIFCIRYHMGAFKADDIALYSRAIEQYPNVLYTHTADMIASHIYRK